MTVRLAAPVWRDDGLREHRDWDQQVMVAFALIAVRPGNLPAHVLVVQLGQRARSRPARSTVVPFVPQLI